MEERVVRLDRFKPRDYQIPIFDAFENKGYKRIMIVFPRRAGKDLTAFNVMIRAAIRKIGVYYYIFPTYSQAKKAIWDSITNDGVKFLDFIPEELIVGKNSQEMKITLINDSIIQFVGSTDYDRLMGTNPRGCVFSEYALQDPRAYQFIRPILTANDGWAIFVSTPRGMHNALYDLYQIAIQSDDWFTSKLTIEDTKHISMDLIEKERKEGIMSEDLIQQEYFTSFSLGIEGGYYTKIMDRLRTAGHVCPVPLENGFQVHTSWDLGVRDSTTIIFFQTIGQTVRVIDYYENSKEGLEHYISVLRQKGYIYGKHIAPHDIRVREFGSGITRYEKARQLGIAFTIADNISIEDGIEAVRTALPKIWFDSSKCVELIKAIENYRQEYDSKKKIYHPRPYHNWASHAADNLRYLAVSLSKLAPGSSPEDLDRRYREARYGEANNMPKFFR